MYRILVAIETEQLADGFRRLLVDAVSATTAAHALDQIGTLVATGPQALIPTMAGQAEEGLGDPDTVAAAMSFLAGDLLAVLDR